MAKRSHSAALLAQERRSVCPSLFPLAWLRSAARIICLLVLSVISQGFADAAFSQIVLPYEA
jgi:hypothetical protein